MSGLLKMHEMSNIEIFGGDMAKESADQEGVPPAGVFVFYDC